VAIVENPTMSRRKMLLLREPQGDPSSGEEEPPHPSREGQPTSGGATDEY